MTPFQRKQRLAVLAQRLAQLGAIAAELGVKARHVELRMVAVAAEISRIKLTQPQPENRK